MWVALVGMSKYPDVKYTVEFFFGRETYSQRDQHKNIDRSANLFLRGQNREANQKRSQLSIVWWMEIIFHIQPLCFEPSNVERDITLFNQLQDILGVEVDENFVPCRGIPPSGYPQDEPSGKWSNLLVGKQWGMFAPGSCCPILPGHDFFLKEKKTLYTPGDLLERRGFENLLELVACRGINDGRRSTTGATHTFYRTFSRPYILSLPLWTLSLYLNLNLNLTKFSVRHKDV